MQIGVGGVTFSGKKHYEGVRYNVISVTRGWVGVKFPGKKCYLTLEWPLCLIESPIWVTWCLMRHLYIEFINIIVTLSSCMHRADTVDGLRKAISIFQLDLDHLQRKELVYLTEIHRYNTGINYCQETPTKAQPVPLSREQPRVMAFDQFCMSMVKIILH